MKKLCPHKMLVFVIAIFLDYATTAQIEVGAVGGLSISKFTTFDHAGSDFVTSFSTSPYLGYYTGLFAEFQIQKKLQLQSGVAVTLKGSETNSEVFGGFASFQYRKIQL